MKKKPLTMRTFTCSFQTLAVLFEGCKTAIMVDVEKAALSLRRLSGRTGLRSDVAKSPKKA